jgi:hypothetical protein
VIRISIEVGQGPHLKVAVRARSIEQAVSIASARYPGKEVRVLFPIDPEEFFEGEKSCLHDEVESAVDAEGSNGAGRAWAVGTEAVG